MRMLLITLMLGTLASCESRSGAEPARPKKGQTLQSLVKLKALAALPKPGNVKAQLRVGAVRSAKKWRAFAAKAGERFKKLSSKVKVDWSRQMVVYAIFSGQTNSLSFKRWVGPKKGAAQLQIHWSGIEPHYVDATPGVFHVVERAGVRKITVKVVSGIQAGTTLAFPVR